MPVIMALVANISHADDPGEVALTVPPNHIFEEPTCRGIAGAKLRKGVTLESSNRTGDKEREPDRGTGHLAGRTE